MSPIKEEEVVQKTTFSDSDGELSSDDDDRGHKNGQRTPSPVLINANIPKSEDSGDFFIDKSFLDSDIEVIDESSSSNTNGEWFKSIAATVLSPEVESIANTPKPKRRRNMCYNCDGDHVFFKCPLPRNKEKVRAAQDAARDRRTMADVSRYHDDSKDSDKQFKPGRLSATLREALGIGPDDIPEWVYRMRRMGFINGYPPGYLKKAVKKDTSNQLLSFHSIDGKDDFDASDANDVDPLPPVLDQNKMVFYFGFNKTYRHLRDKERGAFSVPPFEEFVAYHQQMLIKSHEESLDVKRRKFVPKEQLKQKDVEIISIASPRSSEDDCIIIDREPSSEVPVIPLDETMDEIVSPSKGEVITEKAGTPVLSRKGIQGGSSEQTHAPGIDAFQEGVVPFKYEEEPTASKGFFKKMSDTIRKLAGR